MARTEKEPEFSPLPESALDDSETSSVQSPQPPPVSKNPTPVSPQTLADHVYRSLSNVPQMNTRSSDGNSGRDEPRRASESIGGSTGRPDKPPASSIPHHMGRMVSGPHIGSKTSGSLTADMVSRAGSSAGPVQHSSKGKAKMIMSSKERLKKEEQGVVKRRDGGVLARGFILKTDHYPTGEALDLDFHLEGAPNWRAPREESLDVYGVAQPTLPGLKGILSVLGCRPPAKASFVHTGQDQADGTGTRSSVVDSSAVAMRRMSLDDAKQSGWMDTEQEGVYISGRPFVLRDISAAKTSMALSDRAENLEGIERRLRDDMLLESKKYGGMILTHDELETGELVPTWTAIDEDSVTTFKEAHEKMKREGWVVDYYRTPISSDRPIEDNYLDAYVRVLRECDPLTTALVFNDGLGAVRATFAMVAALLVKRKKYMLQGLDEPFTNLGSGMVTPAQGWQAAQFFKQAAHQQAQNRALLHLTRLIGQVLADTGNDRLAGNATDLLASHPTLLDSMRNAYMGNYQVVLSLLSSIENGKETKALVDTLIDSCDAVVNLREIIVDLRMRYSVSTADERTRISLLDRATQALERYFFLVAFASYVDEEDAGATGKTFADWLMQRPEIWNQIQVLRRRGGGRLFVFTPINDLTPLSKAVFPPQLQGGAGRKPGIASGETGKQETTVLGDEFSQYVISQRSGIILRAGTLLKSDIWSNRSATSHQGIKGAIGFRQVPAAPIFALGQPTEDAILHVVDRTRELFPIVTKVLWLNLREEPIAMLLGEPYCLRKEIMSLRNLKDYSGVSGARLEVLEDRLVSDVLAELRTFDNRILLHTETDDGHVAPVWEDVRPTEVQTVRQVMDQARQASEKVELEYRRLPLTAMSTLDFQDIQEMLTLCLRNDLRHTVIILNDQLGRGRSTLASVFIKLIAGWIQQKQEDAGATPKTPRLAATKKARSSWQIINSCLRVLRRNGIYVKAKVDEAIDQCGEAFNCRTVIEDAYRRIEDEEDSNRKKAILKDGKIHLARYLQLIQFQAYLDDLPADSGVETSFATWYANQPVFKTFETELKHGGVEILTPLSVGERTDGPISNDEADTFVMARHGGILSSGTIIKSDLFLGLQKMSLPERVDGAANYRKVPLVLQESVINQSCESPQDTNVSKFVYGTGMPTAEGLRRALKKMGAEKGGKRDILWTSLREEPVLYVSGIPHVLRLYDKPVVNIETTGVDAKQVEAMEDSFKRDVLDEIRKEGRLLLHDEVETTPGHFEVVPIWETVDEKDIMTPRELYEQVQREGYRLDYRRIAVTDEQAPLPEALTAIIDRVEEGLGKDDADFVFNCQMGRGRTSTGMIAGSIIASIESAPDATQLGAEKTEDDKEEAEADYSEEAAYMNGEYKMILRLMSVLTHGKEAKRIADKAIDVMSGVQNLRQAIYDYKLKIDACEPGSAKQRNLNRIGINYAYRYAMLIVLTAYLLEVKEMKERVGQAGEPAPETPVADSEVMDAKGHIRPFAEWLKGKREIRTVLGRQTLD
ncbi:hypothetical protein QFC24_002188 [Naganishia onofrii]|uniref:Uncharacterized protein n=1 Tax=Naganishia onofrii TaxID=1851511 RepID=A0ACC2XQY0_9TREE|nr:hypothetical protein QFC24_002188 [Naganishia onofrii]